MFIKTFASILTYVSLCTICYVAHGEVNVSGSLDDARRMLDNGEAFGFNCSDTFHTGKCADAGFNHGEEKIYFFKNYNGGWGHVIHICKTGYHCINNRCVYGTGNSTCNDANLIHRCDGLYGNDYNNCISCSALSNWETWDQNARECNGTPVTHNITITVTDTNGTPLPDVTVSYYHGIQTTDENGNVELNINNITNTIDLVYGCIWYNLTIDPDNTTIKLDLHWFDGMQPGQLQEIDCTDTNNTGVCAPDANIGIIGLNYDSKPICRMILECQSGKEWFLNNYGNADCRTGSGPSRTTDFSEIADNRCDGLYDTQESTCIDCTKQNWNAWDWSNNVCNNTTIENNTPAPDNSTSSATDINEIKDSIEQISSDLHKISNGFGQSRWKTANGNFNGARLASDSVAGVVLGTAGGLITSNIIKNNQIKGGFEDIQCVINGQVVSGYNDEFVVGIQ